MSLQVLTIVLTLVLTLVFTLAPVLVSLMKTRSSTYLFSNGRDITTFKTGRVRKTYFNTLFSMFFATRKTPAAEFDQRASVLLAH